MSDDTVRLVWFGVLLLHGLGHGGALAALAWGAAKPGSNTGSWTSARTWLAPALAHREATALASLAWVISLAGFVTAALLYRFGSAGSWESVAVASAVVSGIGILAFFHNWPMFNTLAALAVNVVVVWAVLVGRPAPVL